jgi:hypothetical protein
MPPNEESDSQAVAETEVLPPAPEEGDAPEPEQTEPEPEDQSKATGMDKALQKFQMRQTTMERQLLATHEKLDSLSDALASFQETEEARAAPKQQQANLDQASQDLDQLLSDIGDDEEIPSGKQIRQALSKIAARLPNGSSPEATALKQQVSALEKRLEDQDQRVALAESQANASIYWSQWKVDHGNLDGQPIWNACFAEATKKYPESSSEFRKGLALADFNDRVKKAQSDTSQQDGRPKTPVPGTTPPKPTTGTQTVTTGASGSAAATSTDAKAKIAMWQPD